MVKCLVFVLMMELGFSREIPLFLGKNISKESSAVIFKIPQTGGESKQLITMKVVDTAIDDSGNVHLMIDEYRHDLKHIWYYQQYDKNGNPMCKKEIYGGNYLTTLHSFLVARVIINPDLTVLVVYPDTEFYTCWAKLDREGNLIERHEPRWWQGDANFQVCSAGQDSFHIITFPISFHTLLKQHDSLMGDLYLNVEPTLLLNVLYSNNFALKEQRVHLKAPYFTTPIPIMVLLPDKRIFCFSTTYGGEVNYGRAWFLDGNGVCYSADQFDLTHLDEIYFAKVDIDTTLQRIARDIRVPLNWGNGSEKTWISYFLEIVANSWKNAVAIFPEGSITVAFYYDGALYLVKYNLAGRIIQPRKGTSKIVEIADMNEDHTFSFITPIYIPERSGEALDKTIYYWGFNDLGDFFLQIY